MALQISKYIIRHILSFYSKILSPCNHIMLLSVAQLYIFNVLTAKEPCPDEGCGNWYADNGPIYQPYTCIRGNGAALFVSKYEIKTYKIITSTYLLLYSSISNS